MKVENDRLKELLFKLGVRRLGRIAEELGISRSTVIARFKRLVEAGYVEVYRDVDYTLLGLTPMEVEVSAAARVRDVERIFRGFWIFRGVLLGFDGEVCILYRAVPPAGHREEILRRLEESFPKAVRAFRVAGWFHPVNGTVADWVTELAERVRRSPKSLPRRLALRDPVPRPLMKDELDAKVLRHLELRPTARFSEIARSLRVPSRIIRYHYKAHLENPGVVGPPKARWGLYSAGLGHLTLNLRLGFRSEERMARFVNALDGLAPAAYVSRLFDEMIVSLDVAIEPAQLISLLKALRELRKSGYLASYIIRVLEDVKFRAPPYGKLRVRAGRWRL